MAADELANTIDEMPKCQSIGTNDQRRHLSGQDGKNTIEMNL
ncbi:MAG: hypothetical protein ACRD4W_09455 [Nitrososphaeraceae archaeon]